LFIHVFLPPYVLGGEGQNWKHLTKNDNIFLGGDIRRKERKEKWCSAPLVVIPGQPLTVSSEGIEGGEDGMFIKWLSPLLAWLSP